MHAIQTLPGLVARHRGDVEALVRTGRASVAAWWRAGAAAWRRARDASRTRAALDRLDDATLRDLGMARPELSSVAAELHGEAAHTRRQRFVAASS